MAGLLFQHSYIRRHATTDGAANRGFNTIFSKLNGVDSTPSTAASTPLSSYRDDDEPTALFPKPNGGVLVKRKSDPIPFRHQRSSLDNTDCEERIQLDKQVADYRDYCMYTRILSGMSHSKSSSRTMQQSIIRTRTTQHHDDDLPTLVHSASNPTTCVRKPVPRRIHTTKDSEGIFELDF